MQKNKDCPFCPFLYAIMVVSKKHNIKSVAVKLLRFFHAKKGRAKMLEDSFLIQWKDISTVKPYKNNAKKHDKTQIKNVAETYNERYGQGG